MKRKARVRPPQMMMMRSKKMKKKMATSRTPRVSRRTLA